ncbi:Uncharacterised protein [Vibrio cholerae]|nr:Uncharacterised protein [Vibrio cholerae]
MLDKHSPTSMINSSRAPLSSKADSSLLSYNTRFAVPVS